MSLNGEIIGLVTESSDKACSVQQIRKIQTGMSINRNCSLVSVQSSEGATRSISQRLTHTFMPVDREEGVRLYRSFNLRAFPSPHALDKITRVGRIK